MEVVETLANVVSQSVESWATCCILESLVMVRLVRDLAAEIQNSVRRFAAGTLARRERIELDMAKSRVVNDSPQSWHLRVLGYTGTDTLPSPLQGYSAGILVGQFLYA
jgi:hypothetical protein